MKKLNIPYVNLSKQWRVEKATLLKIIDKVIETQDWVGGTEIKKFEKNILKYTNSNFAVALNSGTDSLTLGLASIGVRKMMKLLPHLIFLLHP